MEGENALMLKSRETSSKSCTGDPQKGPNPPVTTTYSDPAASNHSGPVRPAASPSVQLPSTPRRKEKWRPEVTQNQSARFRHLDAATSPFLPKPTGCVPPPSRDVTSGRPGQAHAHYNRVQALRSPAAKHLPLGMHRAMGSHEATPRGGRV